MPKKKGEGTAAYCVLTLPLITEPWQEHILEKRFEIMRKLQNSLTGAMMKKFRILERQREYCNIMKQLKNKDISPEERKALYKARQKMLQDAGFSEFGFMDAITPMQKRFVAHIGTNVAHRTASDVWRAFEKFLYGDGKRVHFKRFDSVTSVGNKKYGVTMTIKDGCFIWKGGRCANRIDLRLPIKAPRSEYERLMHEMPIRSLRVVKKWMKSRWKYYLQLTLEGSAVKKEREIKTGRVGIDIGMRNIAVVSETEAYIIPLADKIIDNEKKQAYLQRKMDRSRRATNPDNYNADGTIRRGIRLRWVKSNHYKRIAGKVRELQRRNAAIRKYQHTCLANFIMAHGDHVFVKKLDYKGLQMRKKKTETDPKGSIKSKSRQGKAIANRAPALFEMLLAGKLAQYGGCIEHITYSPRRYDHISKSTRKVRNNMIQLSNGDVLRQDLYSAFLIRNADVSLEAPNLAKCEETYDAFRKLHNVETARFATGARLNYDQLGA